MSGYSNRPLYTTQVETIYVEMFKNRSFWRDVEYDLTDALAKRIEIDTPYKIVSSPDRADSQISGQILYIGQSLLTIERERGTALEKEVQIQAVVNWKNLKSGKLLIDNRRVSAAAGYTPLQNQSFNYAARLAANNLAERIVELMEEGW